MGQLPEPYFGLVAILKNTVLPRTSCTFAFTPESNHESPCLLYILHSLRILNYAVYHHTILIMSVLFKTL